MLKGLGEDWIPGYKPAFNFQMTLVDAVARWLALNPVWLGRQPGLQPACVLREAVQIWVPAAPAHRDLRAAGRAGDQAARDSVVGRIRPHAHVRRSSSTAGNSRLSRQRSWPCCQTDRQSLRCSRTMP
ncbi:hypothetical protein DSD19_13190 [Rhodovulum sp. BSW8]|nr:hypothetical protein DSD19_13190 [Rhodovulum sp. BSW8]